MRKFQSSFYEGSELDNYCENNCVYLDNMVAPPLAVLWVHEVRELGHSEAFLCEQLVHESVVAGGVSRL